MARLTIDLPEKFEFSTEIPVLIGHINRGDHLANEALVGLLNEALQRFLAERPAAGSVQHGLMAVNADLAVSYRSESHYGDMLRIEVAATGFHRVGYDIVYRVTALADQRLVALARTSHVLVDLETRRAASAPASLLAALNGSPT